MIQAEGLQTAVHKGTLVSATATFKAEAASTPQIDAAAFPCFNDRLFSLFTTFLILLFDISSTKQPSSKQPDALRIDLWESHRVLRSTISSLVNPFSSNLGTVTVCCQTFRASQSRQSTTEFSFALQVTNLDTT